jgi:hypothetical protein
MVARTGFFVLYSVFKERLVERADRPELDALRGQRPPERAAVLASVQGEPRSEADCQPSEDPRAGQTGKAGCPAVGPVT